jgi:exonuclease III
MINKEINELRMKIDNIKEETPRMKWIKKEDPTICCLQETHLTNRNKHRLRMKG